MSFTMQEAKAMINRMPRVPLGFFPTPLHKLGSLSEELGVNLWIKRDDFTGSNLFGGNKTRKLEFLIGKAKADGAECVFTYGATQSNHAMQTSWAAAKNGLKPILYLAVVVPPDPDDYKANLLLDGIYGAEIHVVDLEEGESFADAEKRSFKMGKSHIARLEEQGIKSYDIPMGGANEYGTLGYVNCMIVKSGLPKVSYKLLVFLAMIYVSILTVWGWVMDNFGSFISMAAQIQGPIIGMTVVDYLIVKKRKISLKSLYNIDGHRAYDFTNGFNLVGLGCLFIAFITNILFVYNPLTAAIKSPIFFVLTGSGYTAGCGGLLYWLASLTPLRTYMLRDRSELDIV